MKNKTEGEPSIDLHVQQSRDAIMMPLDRPVFFMKILMQGMLRVGEIAQVASKVTFPETKKGK